MSETWKAAATVVRGRMLEIAAGWHLTDTDRETDERNRRLADLRALAEAFEKYAKESAQ